MKVGAVSLFDDLQMSSAGAVKVMALRWHRVALLTAGERSRRPSALAAPELRA